MKVKRTMKSVQDTMRENMRLGTLLIKPLGLQWWVLSIEADMCALFSPQFCSVCGLRLLYEIALS